MKHQNKSVDDTRDGNRHMLMNQAVEFKHHVDELSKAVKKTEHVDAWVVAKAERATTDLSDITHYLEGQSQNMARGGVTYLNPKMQERNTYHYRRYNNAIGSFQWSFGVGKNRYHPEGILYPLDEFDRRYYALLPLQKGEYLFRYRTDRMPKGQRYLIKINLDKSLIYFMDMDKTDGDDDKNIVFSKKGVKADYIVVEYDNLFPSMSVYGHGGNVSASDTMDVHVSGHMRDAHGIANLNDVDAIIMANSIIEKEAGEVDEDDIITNPYAARVFLRQYYEEPVDVSMYEDLFEKLDRLPQEARQVVEKYSDVIYDEDSLSHMRQELEELGYTFKYDKDNKPYDLIPKEFADGGKTAKQILSIPAKTMEEITDSVKMGYDTIVEGMISPKRKGILLVNKDYKVRGTYDLGLKDVVQSIVDSVKKATDKMDDGGMAGDVKRKYLVMYSKMLSRQDGSKFEQAQDRYVTTESLDKVIEKAKDSIRMNNYDLVRINDLELNAIKAKVNKEGVVTMYADGGMLAEGGQPQGDGNVEYVLYGVKIGSPAHMEEILLESKQPIVVNDRLVELAKSKGYDRLRLSSVNLSAPPDFVKSIKMAEGGISGGYEDLSDRFMSQKIEMLLDKAKPYKYYYIDEESNSLIVVFSNETTLDTLSKFYLEVASSREFFDAEASDADVMPTGDVIYKIPLKHVVAYAGGGETDDSDMVLSLYESFLIDGKEYMRLLSQSVYTKGREQAYIERAKNATFNKFDDGRYDYKQEVYLHKKGVREPYLDKNKVFADGGVVDGEWVVYNPKDYSLISTHKTHRSAKIAMKKLWDSGKYDELGIWMKKDWNEINKPMDKPDSSGGDMMARGGVSKGDDRRRIKGSDLQERVENTRRFKALIERVYEDQSIEQPYPKNFIESTALSRSVIVKYKGKIHLKKNASRAYVHYEFLDDPNFVRALEYVDRPYIATEGDAIAKGYMDGGMMAKGGKTKETCYIEYLNKKKGFTRDRKYFDSYQDAVKWGKANIPNFNLDMVKFEYADGGMMARGGNITKGKIWRVDFSTTDGERGYNVYQIEDTKYFSNNYGGGFVVRSKVIESSLPKLVGTYSEDSKEYLKKVFAGKYPFAYQLADGGIMAKGGVTFQDKVDSIARRLEGTKVPRRLWKDYGKEYNEEEAILAGRRIAGSMKKKGY